jgi:hypothetical protein
MINLAWGGYPNGHIPDSAMSPIDSQGHRLEHVAAAQFLAMQAAMLRDLGRTISVAPGDDSAFRTIAQQQADYASYMHGGNVAAYPGTSNHGYGRAVDITGYESSAAVWSWLLAHAGAYGYSWATGQASGERWHWESLNTPSATATAAAHSNALPAQEEEMAAAVCIRETSGAIWLAPDDGDLIPLNSTDEVAALAASGALRPITLPDGSKSWWIQLGDGLIISLRKSIAARKHAQIASGK